MGCHSLDCLVTSWVPGCWLPVVVIEDFPLQRFIWWDHESSLCEPEFEAGDCGRFLEREGEFGLPLQYEL